MTGGVIQPVTTTNVGGLTGEVLCVYDTVPDESHTTTWVLQTGGSSRAVQVQPGSPVMSVNAGKYTITFQNHTGDKNPPNQVIQLAAGQRITMYVHYT